MCSGSLLRVAGTDLFGSLRAFFSSSVSLLALSCFGCSIINDILDYSKIEAGSLRLTLAPVHLVDCVESAMLLVFDMAGSKGLLVSWFVDPKLPQIILMDSARRKDTQTGRAERVQGGQARADRFVGMYLYGALLLVQCNKCSSTCSPMVSEQALSTLARSCVCLGLGARECFLYSVSVLTLVMSVSCGGALAAIK